MNVDVEHSEGLTPFRIQVGSQLVVPDLHDGAMGTEIEIDGQRLVVVTQAQDREESHATELLLRLLRAVSGLQAERASEVRAELLKAMISADIDPVPSATISQAKRLASQRERLLAGGAFDVQSLHDLRADKTTSTTRTWLSRQRAKNRIFAVSHNGRSLIPSFQLDVEGEPRAAIGRVLDELAPAELGGWATWTWFTSASPWLGGSVPVDLLGPETDRVVAAARRFSSNAA